MHTKQVARCIYVRNKLIYRIVGYYLIILEMSVMSQSLYEDSGEQMKSSNLI